MNYTRVKNGLKITVLGCAALSAWWANHQFHASADAQIELQRLQAARARLNTQIARLSQTIAEPKIDPANIDETPASWRGTKTNIGTREGQTETARAILQPRDMIVSDPVLQNLYLASERASLGGRYAALFRRLQLTPSQIESLEDLIARRNEQRMDLDDVVRTNHLDEADPSVTKLREKATKSFYADFVGLLGQPAYLIFTTYERTLPTWEMVNQFAGVVALEGHPLSEPQATQLVDELANASPPFREGGVANTNQIDWPSVITATPTILTKPQQTAFLNMAPRYPVTDNLNDSPEPDSTSSSP